MRIASAVAAAVVVAAAAGSAWADPFSFAGPSASGVDTNPATDVSFVIAQTGAILDLNISMDVSVNTTDFNITLIHGSTSVLVYQGSHSFSAAQPIQATFDDQAGVDYDPSTSVIGTFRPSPGFLSDFNGQDLSGTWTLEFIDLSGFPGEGSNLNSWSLDGLIAPEPSSLALGGLGVCALASFVVARRRRPAVVRA